MPIETTVANVARDSTQKGLKVADSAIKKAWNILDAASEKKPPSEYLSKQAISAVQGKITGA